MKGIKKRKDSTRTTTKSHAECDRVMCCVEIRELTVIHLSPRWDELGTTPKAVFSYPRSKERPYATSSKLYTV